MSNNDQFNKLANQIISLSNALNITSNKPIDGEKKMNDNMSVFSKRIAEKQQLRQASKVGMDFNVSDNDGHKIVLSSSTGDIKAYYKEAQVNWAPPVFSNEDLEKMSTENGLIHVANNLLSQFRLSFDKTQEEQLKSERKDSPDVVQEEQLKSDRKDSPDVVQEEQLKSERKDSHDVVQEEQLSKAGLYSRKFNDNNIDVQESLLEDARSGSPNKTWEELLEVRRSKSTEVTSNEAVASVSKALARTIVSMKIMPNEVIETINTFDFDKLSHNIALAQIGNTHRRKLASRNSYHNNVSALTITASIYDELGKIDNIHSDDITGILKLATAHSDTFEKVITNQINEVKIESNHVALAKTNTISANDKFKASMEILSDKSVELDRNHLKSVFSALGTSAKELKVLPNEVLSAINNVDENVLAMDIQLARSENSINQRIADRERRQYFDIKLAASSSNDIYGNVIGWIADYAIAFEIPTATIIKTAKSILQNPKAAVKLLDVFIQKKAMKFTEDESSTKTFIGRLEEFGLDAKSSDFQNQLRDKIINILKNEGYSVDPNTFSMTDVNVSESGEVTATISTRYSKTVEVSANSSTPDTTLEDNSLDNSDVVDNVDSDVVDSVDNSVVPEEPIMTPQSTLTNDDENTIMTTAAAKYRNNRNKTLNKYSQMAPGLNQNGGGLVPPQGMGMGSPMGTNPMNENTTPVSGLTGGPDPALDAGLPNTEEKPLDSVGSDDGVKKPWGTVCPQCGSSVTDVVDGEGTCNTCHAKLEFSFIVNVKPNSGEKSESKVDDDLSGLGDVTSPAPSVDQNVPQGLPGGNTGVLAQVSWVVNPDVFVKVASTDVNEFDRGTTLKLPAGYVCPSCGNRKAEKVRNNTYCVSCGTMAKTSISKCKIDKTKIVASVIWI